MTVDLLILGAGWTSTFLVPLCIEESISYAATSRSGAQGTLKFEFISDSEDPEPFKVLPDARTILITFPIVKSGASERLVALYKSTHSANLDPSFIQLGVTSIWDSQRGSQSVTEGSRWYDRHSPFVENDRSIAEQELLNLSSHTPTTVLNLAGLWGGSRSMRKWVGKVAPTKEVLKNKGSLHMIHGVDVARAILAVHAEFAKASGQRWILTDGRVYDWWDLASSWGSPSVEDDTKDRGPHPRWVRELMREQEVRSLPRNVEALGRALDSREFWETFSLDPIQTLLGG